MADKDLGDELEKFEEGIENLKNKEFRLFGIKMTPMTISALIAGIGSVVGALYGGFLMYQKVEQAIEFVEQQEEYEALIGSFEQRMEVIELKLEEGVDYTRDIKKDLKDDIIRIEQINDSTTRRVKEIQTDVDNRIRNMEDLNRETEKDVRDVSSALDKDVRATMRETEDRLDEKMEKLNVDLNKKLQEALDNPLNN
jgi:hypothetical protein